MSEARDWNRTHNEPWSSANLQSTVSSRSWVCGFCGTLTSSTQGADSGGSHAFLRICSYCNSPTFTDAHGEVTPGIRPGDEVAHLPQDVAQLYDEARSCMAVGSASAAILAFRKIVMHVAVEKGAATNKAFVVYVTHLIDNHFVPTGSSGWVDYIRDRANEENHEIKIATHEDADGVLVFVTQLLKNVYELPLSVPGQSPDPSPSGET